jgi:MATE family multidrug resistance protein
MIPNLKTATESSALTKYPIGSFRELGSISWPLVFSLFFICLMGICDRFFLSRYSLQALEACGSASYLAWLFQIPFVRITSIAQVFVGQYRGAGQNERLGEVIWQMIWFSLMTMLLTVPLGLITASFFFDNTSIKDLGVSYFNCLVFANFLFPLGAALASFFTGQGKTRIVSWVMAISLGIHISLDFLLIFGIPGIFPALGIFGAALATVIAQALYCLILFILFVRKKEQELHGTGQWRIRKDPLLQCIRLGMPRAMARLITLIAWAAVVRILTRFGGDYLLVLSITGSFCIFFSCLSEGLGQGLITVSSYIIGRRKEKQLLSVARSAFMGLACIMGVLTIFLLIFPMKLLVTFYPKPIPPTQLIILIHACYGLWLFFLFEGLSWIGLSILTALGDTRFLMLYSAITAWLFNYFPIYFAFYIMNWPAETLWCLMAIPCLTSSVAYLWRILKKMRLSIGSEDLVSGMKKEDKFPLSLKN